MAIECRRFQGEEDYFKLKRFLEESISISGPEFYFNVNSLEFGNELYEARSYTEAAAGELANAFLWFEDDKLMGGIWANKRIQ